MADHEAVAQTIFIQEFVEKLNDEFRSRLQKKPIWREDEIYQEYLQALAVAAISSASSIISIVEEVFSAERQPD